MTLLATGTQAGRRPAGPQMGADYPVVAGPQLGISGTGDRQPFFTSDGAPQCGWAVRELSS
jgi:hypothetical protein